MQHNESIVIELAPFRVRPGITEEEIRAASRALQDDFLAAQPGFVRRELLRADDGSYVDLVWWESRAAAEAMMAAVASSPACARFFALMEGADPADPGAGVRHFARVAAYG